MSGTADVNAKLNTAREAALSRIAELEDRLSRAEARGAVQQPLRDMVSFVGGPLHGTDKVLDAATIDRGRYEALVAVPLDIGDVAGVADGVRAGVYRLMKFATRDSHLPYTVAVWEGLS